MEKFNEHVDRVRQITGDDPTSLKLLEKLILSSQSMCPVLSDHQQTAFNLCPFSSIPKKKRGSIGTAEPATSESRKLPAIYFYPSFSIAPVNQGEGGGGGGEEVDAERRLEKKQKLKGKKIKKDFQPRENQPELTVSVELRERIAAHGGIEIKLVINKVLQGSDLVPNQNRLSMPKKQAGDGFLEEGEKSKMKEGMPVKLLEPCGKITEMELKIWKLLSSENYVLKAGENRVTWKKVIERQENKKLRVFEKGNEIRVWSFRVEGQLWLTLEKVE